jgi:hypothetical protein
VKLLHERTGETQKDGGKTGGKEKLKLNFTLWLHDMEKPVPKPVPKAGSLFCMETKDIFLVD